MTVCLNFIVELTQLTFSTDTPQEPSTRPRRKRNLTTVVQEIMDNRICADEGCETVIEDQDLLRCGTCNLVVSDSLMLLLDKY